MHPSAGGADGVNIWLDIGVVAICIVLSACFSGAETALTATSRARVAAMESRSGSPA